MFDTIVLPGPIACRQCGTAILSTQTKQFASVMDTYRVGDVIPHSPVIIGVLEEELYCESCRRFDQKVYLTLWHCLLTGVYEDQAQAESRLMDVDRADILEHLITHQREERRLGRLVNRLLNTLHTFAEFLSAEDREKFLARPLALLGQSELRELLEDVKDAAQATTPDALTAARLLRIIERFRGDLGRAEEEQGFF